ncbi:MAG TPA: hypothetical protein VG713_10920 [Pirellulales bacterium]|nr:hypothetical protein [Pirellulales bacterium]
MAALARTCTASETYSHMNQTLILVRALAIVFAVASSVHAGDAASTRSSADSLAPWRTAFRVRTVGPDQPRHTIHSYYLATPESPDGRKVLYYSSAVASGEHGELCILDRATGEETTLVKDIRTEDAHRAACQQWLSGGKRIAFHNVRDGHWSVSVVDLASADERVVATDRQLAFGQPTGDVLPIYGCHWNPGAHRDLELLDVATGRSTVPVTASAVAQKYGSWLHDEFGDKPISIFFPVLSPDRSRVFFKIAAGSGTDNYRSKGASHRQGLIAFDLDGNDFLFMRSKWGHPAWHPDSRTIIEMGNVLIDSADGAATRIPNMPYLSGSHPSVSPDGKLFVTDGLVDSVGGPQGQWGVMVGDMRGGAYVVLHRFDNSHGARSWRVSHPHPAFSADGQRIYFNESSGDWTRLHVIEAGGS